MNSVKTEQMLDEIADELYQRGYADSDIWLDDHKGPYRASVGKIIEKAFEESRKEISALREAVKVMKWELERLSSVVCVDDGVLIDKCLSAVSKLLPEPGKPEVKTAHAVDCAICLNVRHECSCGYDDAKPEVK